MKRKRGVEGEGREGEEVYWGRGNEDRMGDERWRIGKEVERWRGGEE